MFAVFGKYNKKIRMSLFISVIVIFAIGLITAQSFKETLHADNQAQIHIAVNQQLDALAENLIKAMDVYALKLKNMRSYLHGLGLGNLDKSSFKHYMLDADLEKNYPGARGFGVIRYVEPEDQDAFLTEITADRGERFDVNMLQRHSRANYIVSYIEPEDRNRASLGLDIASERFRREAANEAAEQGSVMLTAPLQLVQAKQQQGFLLLYPVFKAPDLAFENEKLLFGWVYAPLVIDDILGSIYSYDLGLNMEFSDLAQPESSSFFSILSGEPYPQSNEYEPKAIQATQQLYAYGRTWSISARPTQKFIDSLGLASPTQLFFQVLVAFAVLILLLVNGVYFISRRMMEQHHKNELATIVENGMDGIIGLDNTFCIKYWNETAQHMFGFDRSALKVPFLEWLEDNYSADYLIDLFRTISNGEPVKGLELEVVSHDFEHKRFLHLNFQPIIQKTLFLGVSVSVVDLTQVRDLQTELEEKNRLLNKQLDNRDSQLKVTTGLHETLLQGAGYIIITTDMHGEVSSANRKFEELLGYDAELFLGKKVTDIFPLQTLEEHTNYVKEAFACSLRDSFECLVYPLSKQSRFEKEFMFQHKNGQLIELQLNISLIKTEDNEAFGYLFIADDLRDEKALRFDLELMRSAILNSEEILLWLTETGEIISCNPYAIDALGYTEFELTQLSVSDVLEFEAGESWEMIVSDLEASHVPTSDEVLITRQGKMIPCLMMLSELRIEDERFFFIAAKDISDRLAKERVLQDALNLAAQTNVVKDQFLANMGHELRTPLNEVHGSLQLLQQTSLSGEQLEYLSRAKSSVRLLTQSIGDVLDCGEIIRGKMSFDQQRVNLHHLLSNIGQMLAIIAEDKDIQIHFDVAQNLPEWIETDPHRFQQLLMCLLSNAIKFTHQGDVILRAMLKQATQETYELTFEVVDSGVGIAPEKLDAIFDMFAQVEMGADRSFGGLGLGLTISKHIVEMMSGSIDCQSEEGKGSTFIINVLTGRAEGETAQPSIELPPLSVLIVDDNQIALDVLGNLIMQLGWRADMAKSAAQAEQLIKDAIKRGEKFDLALIDWSMPDKNGLELVKTIRRDIGQDNMPVLVMVTAYTKKILEQYDHREVESLLSAFLTKPVTHSVLLDLVAGVLNQDTPHISLSYDMPLDGLRVLLVEDNETNQFIAKNLLRSQGASVVTASDGEQAWQVLQQETNIFDIVLMDIQMPVWDGYRATRQIRMDERFSQLPILAMTANVLAADKAKCFEAGMNGHIGKPFELGQLVQEILKLTRPSSESLIAYSTTYSAHEKSAPAEKLPSIKDETLGKLAELSDVDVVLSLQRFGNTEALYVKSLKMFLKDVERFIDTLERETEDNFSALKPTFHTLKGTAGLLGFVRLSEAAKRCDEEAKTQLTNLDARHLLKSLLHLLEETRLVLEKIFYRDQEAALENENENYAIDKNKLLELKNQLENFNMRATETFQSLEASLLHLDREKTETLGELVSNLQFSDALRQLTHLIDALGS